MPKATLGDLQAHLDKACVQNGWDKNTVTEVFLLFTEEVGELAKEVRLQAGFKKEKRVGDINDLRHEFADVLNYLMDLANRFEIDLTEAYYEKHAINKDRKW